MPNIFQTVIVKRFLSHVLEILTSFAVTLIILQVLVYVNLLMLGGGDFSVILNNYTPSLGSLNSADMTQKSVNSVYQLIVGFTIFYFVYSTFNFFFTFSFLYPKNDFQANLYQKMFGFKKFEFGKKKLTHLQKAIKILYRELILFASIYGFFALLVLTKMQDFFNIFNYLISSNSSIQNVLFSLLALFTVFVAPALLLSIFSLYKSKGKQLFWDFASGVTLK